MFGIYTLYYILGIVMIPGIALGIWAQSRVVSTFNKFSAFETRHGKPANEVARLMLNGAGLQNVKIAQIRGELTDNFNPQTNTVSLSDSVYGKSSIAAVGVAAHEIGHVFQNKDKYAPMKARKLMVPILKFSSLLAWPLILIGLILEMTYYATTAEILIYVGIGIYALNTLFCLITLPIELNASKRAEKMLLATAELDEEEIKGVKKVLNAAALTYVAALVTSVLSLLRLLLFVFALRKD